MSYRIVYRNGRFFSPARIQWAPTLLSHDPSPPLTLLTNSFDIAAAGVKVGGSATVRTNTIVLTETIALSHSTLSLKGIGFSQTLSLADSTVATSKSHTFAPAIVAQDVRLGGAGTYSKIQTYTPSVVTQDVHLGGTTGVVRLFAPTVAAQGVKVVGAGTSTFSGSHIVPVGLNDLRCGGTATSIFVSSHAYTPTAAGLFVETAGTFTATKSPAVALQNVRVAGEGTYSKTGTTTYTATVVPQDVKAGGTGTVSRTRVPGVVTQALRVAGTGAKSLVKTWLALAAGVILAGSATVSQAGVHPYTPAAQGVRAAGSAAVSKTKVVRVNNTGGAVGWIDLGADHGHSIESFSGDCSLETTVAVQVGLTDADVAYGDFNLSFLSSAPNVVVTWYYRTTEAHEEILLSANLVSAGVRVEGGVAKAVLNGTAVHTYAEAPTSPLWVYGKAGGDWTYFPPTLTCSPGLVHTGGTATASQASVSIYTPSVVTQDLRVGGTATVSRTHMYAPRPLTTGLLNHWRLDETDGTRYPAAGVISLLELRPVGSTTGKIGNAAVFGAEATGNNLYRNTNVIIPAGSFTWAGWVYDDPATFGNITIDSRGDGSTQFVLHATGTGYRVLSDGTYALGGWDVGSSSVVSAAASGAAWRFIVCGWDVVENKAFLSLNGAAKTFGTAGVFGDPYGLFLLGGIGLELADTLDGNIDSVSIFSGVLTDSDIAHLYNANVGLDYPFGQDLRLGGTGASSFVGGAVTYSYTVLTQDVRLAGVGSVQHVKAGAVNTQDVRLGGAATVTRTRNWPTVPRDIRLAGTYTVSLVRVPSVGLQDLILGGTATATRLYSYTITSAGVKVQGAATQSKTTVGQVSTADVRLAGTYTYALVKAPPVGLQDLRLGGAAQTSSSNATIKTYTVITKDILAGGTGTRALVHVPSVTPQGLRLGGAATAIHGQVFIPTVGISDIRVETAGTFTATKVPAVALTDVRLAGTAARSFTHVPVVVTQDLRLGGTGVATHPSGAVVYTYAASGGVVVGGVGSAIFNGSHVYTAVTQDVRLAGTGAVSQTHAYPITAQGVLVQGAGTATHPTSHTVPVQTQDVKLSGLGAVAKAKAWAITAAGVRVGGAALTSQEGIHTYSAVTQDVRLSGSADRSTVHAAAVGAQDLRLGGSGTYSASLAQTYIPTVIPKDLVASGFGFAVRVKVGTVTTQDVRLSGTVTVSHEGVYPYTAVTQDVRLAGAATVAHSAVYPASVTTQDVRLAGTGTIELVHVPAVQTSDIRLSGLSFVVRTQVATLVANDLRVKGAGTYYIQAVGSTVYNATGGVRVGGTASTSRVIVYVAPGATSGALVGGSAGVAHVLVATVVGQDLRLGGTASRDYPGKVQTTDVRLAGTADHARAVAPPVTTQDVRLGGSYTIAVERAYSAVTQDLRLGGSYSIEHVWTVVGTGGVIVGGTYWPYGSVVSLEDIAFTIPQIDGTRLTLPGVDVTGFVLAEFSDEVLIA